MSGTVYPLWSTGLPDGHCGTAYCLVLSVDKDRQNAIYNQDLRDEGDDKARVRVSRVGEEDRLCMGRGMQRILIRI